MSVNGYLHTKIKTECYGCEACIQSCGKAAITMIEDEEGFRYPEINNERCVQCGKCHKVCPYENEPCRYQEKPYVFGGYHLDKEVRFGSTSGGAFSAIVEAFCDENYVIYGAEAIGLKVYHSHITEKKDIAKFRKSKYSQSIIDQEYCHVKDSLLKGKKVLFSGTPCQVAALRAYLGSIDCSKLLTVEVVCEGVPSPLYVRKLEREINERYGMEIESLDYRYTGKGILSKGKWDFQQMKIELKAKSGKKRKHIEDRWFNPFWSIWLSHLMSRPSCYECQFATQKRVADITLGDLWGVHLYCPELYGSNGGASLVVANSEKGKEYVLKAQQYMYGHELEFEDALRYQSPMRKHIDSNALRSDFVADLKGEMDFNVINKKWSKKPSFKLLWQKYVWGNRQKIFVWNLKKGRKS